MTKKKAPYQADYVPYNKCAVTKEFEKHSVFPPNCNKRYAQNIKSLSTKVVLKST